MARTSAQTVELQAAHAEAAPLAVADDLIRSLGELGLTLNEARAYLSLLQFSPATAARVAERAGVPRPKVYEALHSLEQRGFCSSRAEGVATFEPVDPERALAGWIRHREQERRLSAERDERLASELVQALPARHEDARGPTPDYMEALFGRARTSEALERVIGAAERRVDMIQQPPFLQPRSRWNLAEVAAIRRGVRVRVLYTPEAIAVEHRYADLRRAGGEIRVAAKVPMKLLVRDGVEAMISLRDPATGQQGITSAVIRHPDLVGPLQLLFNREWRKGRRLQTGERKEEGAAG